MTLSPGEAGTEPGAQPPWPAKSCTKMGDGDAVAVQARQLSHVLHPQPWGRPGTLSHCKKTLILQVRWYLTAKGWEKEPLSATGERRAW